MHIMPSAFCFRFLPSIDIQRKPPVVSQPNLLAWSLCLIIPNILGDRFSFKQFFFDIFFLSFLFFFFFFLMSWDRSDYSFDIMY